MTQQTPQTAAERAAADERDSDAAATYARGLVSGEGIAQPVQDAPAARPPATGTREQQEASGAAAATELVGTPEQQRANRAAQASGVGVSGSDAAAGAAEARRLLGKE